MQHVRPEVTGITAHSPRLISSWGTPIENIQELREEAPKFYQNLFNRDHYLKEFSKLIVEKQLTPEASAGLVRPTQCLK